MTEVNDPRAWAASAEEDFVLARTALQCNRTKVFEYAH
jgi:hypothetical protein